MRVGDRLCLFDGSGQEATAVIQSVERDSVSVDILAVDFCSRESPLVITLAVAISRGDRMDTTVQKATELGVTGIWPFSSARTGVRLAGDRQAKKREHWQRIATSACEQCGRNQVPPVDAICSYAQLLEKAATAEIDSRLLLHPGSETPLALGARPQSILLLVGPEGGFSDEETTAALAAGFAPLQLGPRILRTETAPLAALAVAQARWGDFGV